MNIKKLVFCVSLTLPHFSFAAPLTLLDAYEKALQYDATINASIAENTAQQEEVNKAFAAFLPQARISMFKGRGSTDSETPGLGGQTISRSSNYDSKNYSLSVRQSLFNKAAFAEYGQAKSSVSRSNSQLEKGKLDLISRVSSAYLEALLSEETIQYSQSQIASVEAQLTQANKKFKSGIGTITEINEAQANLDDVTAKAFEWKNNLEYAKQAIQNLTGEYPDQILALDTHQLTLSVPQPANVEAWIALALEKNPEILTAQYDVQYITQEIEKSRAGHFPTLDLVASRADTSSDSNLTIGSSYKTDSIGLQLNIPIYSGGYVNATVKQSVAKLTMANEKLTERQRAVSADIRKYFNAITNGIAKIRAYEQAVKSNEIAVIGTQKAYQAGIRTNVEVLNAQEKLFAAKRDLARERYQFMFHRVMLKQSAGTLAINDIQEMNTWLTQPALY